MTACARSKTSASIFTENHSPSDSGKMGPDTAKCRQIRDIAGAITVKKSQPGLKNSLNVANYRRISYVVLLIGRRGGRAGPTDGQERRVTGGACGGTAVHAANSPYWGHNRRIEEVFAVCLNRITGV